MFLENVIKLRWVKTMIVSTYWSMVTTKSTILATTEVEAMNTGNNHLKSMWLIPRKDTHMGLVRSKYRKHYLLGEHSHTWELWKKYYRYRISMEKQSWSYQYHCSMFTKFSSLIIGFPHNACETVINDCKLSHYSELIQT